MKQNNVCFKFTYHSYDVGIINTTVKIQSSVGNVYIYYEKVIFFASFSIDSKKQSQVY